MLAVTFAHYVGSLEARLRLHEKPFTASRSVQEHSIVQAHTAVTDSSKDPAQDSSNISNLALANTHHRCSDSLLVDGPTLSDWCTHYTVFDTPHFVTLRQLMHRMSECFRSRALRSRQINGQNADVINRVCALLNQLPLTSSQPSSNPVSNNSKQRVDGLLSASTEGQRLDTDASHQSLDTTTLREMLHCSRQSLTASVLVDHLAAPAAAATAAAVDLTQHDHVNDCSVDHHPVTAAVTAMGLQCVVRVHSQTLTIS